MVEKNLNAVAVIDLGTNTFNLLIGAYLNKQLVILHKEKAPVLLGMGGINRGLISEDAMARAKKALTHFKNEIKKHKVDSVRGIGTSALRDASNSNELVAFSKNELQIPIEIISGDQEAAYIFRGVQQTFDFKRSALIMDIGGGSTEFIQIIGNDFGCVESMDIGVSRIFQMLNCPDDLTSGMRGEIYAFLNEKGSSFFNGLEVDPLIGSSGSFETMYEVIYEKPFPEDGIAHEIEIDKFKQAIDWVIDSTLEERMNNKWIIPIRKKMLPIAALKIKWVMNQVDPSSVFVSPYSLKEGVLSQLATD